VGGGGLREGVCAFKKDVRGSIKELSVGGRVLEDLRRERKVMMRRYSENNDGDSIIEGEVGIEK